MYGKFRTVEQFWHLYSHMLRAEDLPLLDINVFVEGVNPEWEDPANAKGGSWAVKLHKSITAYCWEGILMALIGSQIETAKGDVINGVFLSVRYKENSISVWNSNAEARDDQLTTASIRSAMELDSEFAIDYRLHGVAAEQKEYPK